MSNIIQWLRSHASAILLTAIAVAKAGVLSKGALAAVTGIAAVAGVPF